jgi:hypothetical protein
MSHLPVHHCTNPIHGAAYSNVQVFLRRIDLMDLESTVQHVCLWRMVKMEAHYYPSFRCVYVVLNFVI